MRIKVADLRKGAGRQNGLWGLNHPVMHTLPVPGDLLFLIASSAGLLVC